MTKKKNHLLVRKLSRLLINGILLTCRHRRFFSGPIEKLQARGPVIYLFWHRYIFYVIYRFKHTGARPLISLSRDGERVARISREMGFDPIRGSSSRGGTGAFLSLLRAIRDQRTSRILITADGPKGPPRQVKEGVILLSQKTQVPIVPIAWRSSRTLVLKKTWDRFMVPLPFSTISFGYGDPITIPREMKKEEVPRFKNLIEDRVRNLEKKLERIK